MFPRRLCVVILCENTSNGHVGQRARRLMRSHAPMPKWHLGTRSTFCNDVVTACVWQQAVLAGEGYRRTGEEGRLLRHRSWWMRWPKVGRSVEARRTYPLSLDVRHELAVVVHGAHSKIRSLPFATLHCVEPSAWAVESAVLISLGERPF
jgi:hypothetical protein